MSKHKGQSVEFARLALQRNDEAIRFSETKATLLLTLVGLILGIIVDKVCQLKMLFQNQIIFVRSFGIFSILIFFLGIVIIIVFSIATVFPRLNVKKAISLVYFGDLSKLSEGETLKYFTNLDSESEYHHIISQVHATSKIANHKFILVRYSFIGLLFIIIGSIPLILLIYLN